MENLPIKYKICLYKSPFDQVGPLSLSRTEPNRAEIRTADFQVQYLSASIPPIEPQDHNQTIHRNPVNGLVMIFRFCS